METPKKSQPSLDVDEKNEATTSSPQRALPSPRTPVRSTFYSDDDESDEMESPKFPHLIPIYRRTPDEYDLGGVRIGWDDGFGSPCFQDYDYVNERRSRRRKKSRLFSERHHRSFFRTNNFNSTADSPSPRSCASPNNTALHEELNNYLECILNCLSAKKKNRQLMKAKMEASSSANSSTENNNIGCLLDDSADDEMMMLCSQAFEQKIAADASISNSTINKPTKLIATNSLSINGISPLKDSNNSTNNNVYYHASKKFKPVQSKLFGEEQEDKYKSRKSPCHTITSSTASKSENNCSSLASTSVTNCKKDDSSSSLLDNFANDDEFFMGIDFLEIEQQIMADTKKETTIPATQNCYKQPNKNVDKQLENKPAINNRASTSYLSSSSVLWRRSTSTSSIVNKQQNCIQQPRQFSGVIGTTNNSSDSSGNVKATTTTRYCTPAEIEAKRERARRTLLLKFKSKNRSVS